MWEGSATRITPLGRLTVVATLSALLAGCGWVSRSVEILHVSVSPDGMTIEMSVAACNADLSVDVLETPESVAVYVTALDETDADCADGFTIELEAPLGERIFIDRHDFTEVEVLPSDP